ncbi:MAG: pyridoxamine 5'-phosphate oxidase family protein [Desulfococcaceae bacterium]
MSLSNYFENARGAGVLSTADADGRVDSAIYSRPHVMDDGSVAVIMRDRLSHANLQTNPHAAYMFIEEGPGYKGKRLFLTKIREEKETDLLYQLKRKERTAAEEEGRGPKFLVFFKIDKELPLIGAGEE